MALPADVDTFTLHFPSKAGAYTDASGQPAAVGLRGTLTPIDADGQPVQVRDVASGAMILPQPVPVVIGPLGKVSMELPHSDDPGLSPVGFLYQVRWKRPNAWETWPEDKVFAVPTGSGPDVDFDELGESTVAPGILVPIGTGPTGPSAYELAVQQGFAGTVEQWLASLVGPTGPQGEPGAPGSVTDEAVAAAYGPETGAKVAADPLLRAAFGSLRVGHRLVALGDSITAAGDSVTGNYLHRLDSYANTLTLLSGGRIEFVRNAGIGGNTTEDMLARFDTDVTPYAPTMVSVLAGTNDFTLGFTDDRYRTGIKNLLAKIRSIGAFPLLITSPPINSFATADKERILRNGQWLARYAAAQGIPCFDAFGVVVDPASAGNYKAAYDNGDGIHPNAAGHIAIGTALAAMLNPLLPPMPVLASHDGDPTNLLTGGLFTGDSNADGIGDGWNQSWGPDAGTATFSIVTDADMPGGKAERFTLTGATGHAALQQTVTTGFSSGDTMLLAGGINNQCPGDLVLLGVTYDTDNLSINKHGVQGRTQVELEFVVPAATTQIHVTAEAGYGTSAVSGTVDFGGLTLRNLTTGNMVTP